MKRLNGLPVSGRSVGEAVPHSPTVHALRAWERLRKNSPLFRKSTSLLKQLPRFVSRSSRGASGQPSALANSFPKSGTHLLVQLLAGLPGVSNYDSFIATIPPIRFRERSKKTLLRRISWIAPGELASGHLVFDADYADALAGRGCVHFFIYRDLRDVVVSEVHYLVHMNRWHRLHRYFARLPTEAERLALAISGLSPEDAPFSFPDIGARFEPYAGWLNREDTFPVRFEDLVSERRDNTVRDMAAFFCRRTGTQIDLDELAQRMSANVDPERSRTFRSGRTGRWRNAFTPEHRDLMKDVAGEWLIRLGYEDDLAW